MHSNILFWFKKNRGELEKPIWGLKLSFGNSNSPQKSLVKIVMKKNNKIFYILALNAPPLTLKGWLAFSLLSSVIYAP